MTWMALALLFAVLLGWVLRWAWEATAKPDYEFTSWRRALDALRDAEHEDVRVMKGRW